jgi:peptidyl-prolyl cis-trans isomerase SurA
LQQLKTTLEQQGVTWEEYRKEIGEQIRRNQAIMQIIRPEVNVSDKEIKEYYENHPDDFFKPAQAKIEQIFFPVPNQATPEKEKAILQCAEESLKKIISGENFQNVAMETNLPDYSPSCDVGIYKKGELVGSIDQQAFALTPGELSNIIKTSKGYCIIRVIERSSEQTEKIEETRQAISNFLMQQKMETKIQEWMKKIRTNAYIDIKI